MQRDDCALKLRKLNDATAQNTFTWRDGAASKITLVVDPAQSSLVEGFLHEALHVVLAEEIGEHFNEVAEECVIRALEEHLWRKTMRREDTERWRQIINARL